MQFKVFSHYLLFQPRKLIGLLACKRIQLPEIFRNYMVEDPQLIMGIGPEDIVKETGTLGSPHITTLVPQDAADAVCCIMFNFHLQGRHSFLKKIQVRQN